MSGSRSRHSYGSHSNPRPHSRDMSVDRHGDRDEVMEDHPSPVHSTSSGSATNRPVVPPSIGTSASAVPRPPQPLPTRQEPTSWIGDPSATVYSLNGRSIHPTKHASYILREHCFKQHIQKKGYTWENLTKETKDTYWGEFLKYASWEGIPMSKMRKHFEVHARERYKAYLCKKLKPQVGNVDLAEGCEIDVWEDFIEYWSGDDFKKKSLINTGNRGSGPTYHGGCKAENAWRIDLEKQNKPSHAKAVFDHCFTRKHDGKTFTKEKAAKLSQRAGQEIQRQTEVLEDPDSEVDPNAIFLQVAIEEGGVGHGRIFGLGSSAPFFYGDVNTYGSSQGESSATSEMRETVKRLSKECEDSKRENQRLGEQLVLTQQQIANLSAFCFGSSSAQPMNGAGSSQQAAPQAAQQSQSYAPPWGMMPRWGQPQFSQFQSQFPLFTQQMNQFSQIPLHQPPQPYVGSVTPPTEEDWRMMLNSNMSGGNGQPGGDGNLDNL